MSHAIDHIGYLLTYHSQAIDPPKMEAMDKAWETLLDLGIVEGEDQKSRLTALGRHVGSALSQRRTMLSSTQVAMIPVDVRLAKMLVLGALFKCLDPSKSFLSQSNAC